MQRSIVHNNSQNHSTNMTLFNAIAENNIGNVEFAINNGADVNCYLNDDTPLIKTARGNKLEILKLLIQHNVNIDGDKNRVNALITAADAGYLSIVKELLDNGADPDHLNSHMLNSLHFSIQNKHFDVVKVLLKFDANVNLLNLGWGALDTAVYHRFYEVIPLLIVKGAKLHSQWVEQTFVSDKGNLELQVALQKGAQMLACQRSYINGATFAFFKKLNLPGEMGWKFSNFLTKKDAINLSYVSKEISIIATQTELEEKNKYINLNCH